ncbi:hypothetical protein ElyMa_005201600 [Elysia marginata]|uniref:Death domain-containing protein n=1 Tax=Elysia marginata TaxID=1093978 RepID=A0AAV4JX10_9GAST|nr:hypothetical protein ElyMa_005201600 [Elysia marginata]
MKPPEEVPVAGPSDVVATTVQSTVDGPSRRKRNVDKLTTDEEEEDYRPKKRSKNLIMLDQVKGAMKRYPYTASFYDLVVASRGTSNYENLCNIYLDTRSEKLWQLARDDITPADECVDILSMLSDHPDELPNTMSPEMTLALFNAWCAEQNLNPIKLIWYMVARLQGRVYKKIGLFLHGQSNC